MVIILQLKDPSKLFVKEFLPGPGFLSRSEMA